MHIANVCTHELEGGNCTKSYKASTCMHLAEQNMAQETMAQYLATVTNACTLYLRFREHTICGDYPFKAS